MGGILPQPIQAPNQTNNKDLEFLPGFVYNARLCCNLTDVF
jgi:hypothetical protein